MRPDLAIAKAYGALGMVGIVPLTDLFIIVIPGHVLEIEYGAVRSKT